jgi:hypothetical protein
MANTIIISWETAGLAIIRVIEIRKIQKKALKYLRELIFLPSYCERRKRLPKRVSKINNPI